MPTVSVIIPSYNSAALLPEAVRSVLAQTCGDLEVIVVDDGSTDETRELVAAFSDSRVRYLYQSNAGVSVARNLGASLSSARYICFLDSDDFIFPDKLESQLRCIDSDSSLDMIISGYAFADAAGRLVQQVHPRLAHPSLGLATWLMTCPAVVHAPLIRRESFLAVGGFDKEISIAADWDLWMRMALAGTRMGWDERVLCAYRIHDGSMVSDGRKHHQDRIRSLDKLFKRTDAQDLVGPALRQLAYREAYLHGAARQYIAQQYLTAMGDLDSAIQCDDRLLDDNLILLYEWLIGWATSRACGEDARVFINAVMSHLPESAANLAAYRRKAIAGVCWSRSLAHIEVGNYRSAMRLLAVAAHSQPSLFGNRGFVALLFRSIVGEVRTNRTEYC